MNGRPAERPATYDDLLALPENRVGEIVDGELLSQPRPRPFHARVATRLTITLGSPFDAGDGGPGGWILLDEPELHLGGDVLVPELAGWRRERMPERPLDAAWLELAPDWVCEVLSPSTQALDRTRKTVSHGREAVRWAWLIDPEARTLEGYDIREQGWLRLGAWAGDDTASVPP